jgi:hypothetical protein
MDLVPARPKTRKARRGLSINLPIWIALNELLLQLGCDVSEMTTFNDGQHVRAATCRAWAGAIRKALPQIRRLTVPTAPFVVHLSLDGREPEALRTLPRRTRAVARQRGYHIARLDHDEIEELKRFCDFFETCGGFRQY